MSRRCLGRSLRAVGLRFGLLVAAAGLVALSCGQDEATAPRGSSAGTGAVAGLAATAGGSNPDGGADAADGGSHLGAAGAPEADGGALWTGGGAASGGAAIGPGGTTGAPDGDNSGALLGTSCSDAADCKLPNAASGLSCLTDQDLRLAGGSAPGGLCTQACKTHQECGQLQPGAICFPFGDGHGDGYCIEGCYFGLPDIGDQKCHFRDDFACLPALVVDTGESCLGGCFSDEICSGGTCQVVVPGCLPSCRGDLDCPDGLHCDQDFLRGVCVEQQPSGKRVGEPCTMPSQGSPDPCIGFCQADQAGSSSGHCTTTCGLFTPCGWDPTSQKFDGSCAYAASISENGYFGDFGFCAPVCDCSAECDDPSLICATTGDPLPEDLFNGAGLCFAPDGSVEELASCSAGGGAGGGGAGGGAASAP